MGNYYSFPTLNSQYASFCARSLLLLPHIFEHNDEGGSGRAIKLARNKFHTRHKVLKVFFSAAKGAERWRVGVRVRGVERNVRSLREI
jgi:hypothetical protein